MRLCCHDLVWFVFLDAKTIQELRDGFDTDGLLKIDPARKNKPRLALPIIVYIHRVCDPGEGSISGV